MGKIRSLNQQMQHAISINFKCGSSKRADNKNKQLNNKHNTYSISRTEDLRDTAKNFSNWLKDNTDIRQVKDITTKECEQWLQERAKQCNYNTICEYASRLNKLIEEINHTYNCDINIKDLKIPEPRSHEKVRDVAMDPQHLEQIRVYNASHTSNAIPAIELTARFGLRAKECARLKIGDIDLEHKVLHIVDGAKNGKKRDIPIRDKDIPFMMDLKFGHDKSNDFICGGINEDSINRYLQRALTALGLKDEYEKTSIHAIRKLYATTRYYEELERLSEGKEHEAWSIVQEELGHTNQFRQKLFDTYIK